MPRPLLGALLGLAVASACRSARPHSDHAEVAASASVPVESRASVTDEAIQSIESGDLEHARELLDGLVLSEHLARARAELAQGVPEDALTAIDRALELAPEDAEIQLLKADASLRLAESKIQGGGGSPGLIEGALLDALGAYQSAPESAHARFGASRTAWLLGRTDEALSYARRGLTLLGPSDEHAGALGELSQSAHRIYAEQVFAAYSRAHREGTEEARALALESEDALARFLGRESDDPWGWRCLAELYESEARPAEAKGVCQRGLERKPEDVELLALLARVTTAAEGPAATVKTFEAYVSAHRALAAGRWHLLVARFQLALAGLKQEPRVLDPAAFVSTEADFHALAEEAPELAEGCGRYEVVCRLARGWCAFHAGDLSRAQREFLGMNELREHGIEWQLPGELESGIQGLFLVADAYSTREEKLAAGELFETLHRLQPDQVSWANNAGLWLREAAYDLEREAKSLCRAARGSTTNVEALAELRTRAGITNLAAGSDAERLAFVHAADERFERARALMERSWQAYRPAAELAPDDVRVVNDAALVVVYYLHHDLEWAEQALRHCIEVGGPQVEAKKAALAAEESPEVASRLDGELAQLTEAWGDAHQNLGVFEWTYHKNAEAARAWLEQSLAIWPSRPPVTNSLLPQIRGELLPEEDDLWDLLHWAQPCDR